MKQLARIVLAALVSILLIACEVSEPAATPSPAQSGPATIAPAAPTVLLTAPPADSVPTPTPAAYVPPPTPYPAP